ncbi:MAG TPA: sigma-70 family RNA polymerase sigma factor [Polyangiaceae bacterium]|nr:sigma-70 family RNA polymerase sigma factor [Polyangiaceae bacterium]
MESDESLYARVKHGDLLAFDELYTRYASRLFGFLRAQLPASSDAEDVFHETMMATLESDEVTFEAASFRTWLFRIARNRVLNRLRSSARGEAAKLRLSAGGEPAAPSAEDRVARAQMVDALERAVKRLPSTLSDVYHLRSSGLSYEEMAAVLEIPLGTIKSRMNQMVKVLREELEPWIAR